jgi:hypothetical protein
VASDSGKPPEVEELVALYRLRMGYPQFAISREAVRGRGVRFRAFGHSDTHPHTVITADLRELVEALAGAGGETG